MDTGTADPPADAPPIVVGGGMAGMFTALRIAESRPVTLVCKEDLGWGSTAWAQGGIAAAVGSGDTVSAHVRDTLDAGAGIADPRVAALVCAQGEESIQELMAVGVVFDRTDGALQLAHEGAHSTARVVHAGGDRTGAHIADALAAEVRAHPNITAITGARVEELLVDEGGIRGLRLRIARGEATLHSDQVILATGGAGWLYRNTTNPTGATADGIALAYRAGAAVADLEMIQFHPTALAVGESPLGLISEAVRGAGGVLRDREGRLIMAGVHPQGDLGPRDVVAREVWRAEMAGRGPVTLDLSHLDPDGVRGEFPGIARICAAHGLDLAMDPIPVTPAAHYAMAGVLCDSDGRTTVPGLRAVGECAATGLHGANRLASNSLLESVVLSTRAADGVIGGERGVCQGPRGAVRPVQTGPATRDAVITGVGEVMWEDCGLVRDAAGLQRALVRLDHIPASRDAEAQGLLEVARLVVQAALHRTESRGAHYRSDFPQTDDTQAHRIAWCDGRPYPLGAPSQTMAARIAAVACAAPQAPVEGEADLIRRARAARARLGSRVGILGHHYQKHEVIHFADETGDSLELARRGAEMDEAETLVFLGVHFMAEAADVLKAPGQRVVIPDPAAGCHLAECADIFTVRDAWQQLTQALPGKTLVPLTYMNSGADLKAFVGAHGGMVCTSGNAEAAFRWAASQGDVTVFFPDEHLGRNTCVAMGMAPTDPVVYDPREATLGGIDPAALHDARVILWRGFCNVHVQFTTGQIDDFRLRHPDGVVMVHPECTYETAQAADRVGSTARIIEWVAELPSGSAVAIGTDWNLVDRLRRTRPDLHVECLLEDICPCVTMNRITLEALVETLEALVDEDESRLHVVSVPEAMADDARRALGRMLDLT